MPFAEARVSPYVFLTSAKSLQKISLGKDDFIINRRDHSRVYSDAIVRYRRYKKVGKWVVVTIRCFLTNKSRSTITALEMKRSRSEVRGKFQASPTLRFEDLKLSSFGRLIVFQKLFETMDRRHRPRQSFRQQISGQPVQR